MEGSDYLFLPEVMNRDTALQNLSSQFAAILHIAGMTEDRHGKPRTLYSLRHTAIVRSLRKGIPIELVASNSRTSSDMIRRFYGVHIDNILETGTVYVEKEQEKRDKRFGHYDNLVADLKEATGDSMYDTSAAEEEIAEVAALRAALPARSAGAKITAEAREGDAANDANDDVKRVKRDVVTRARRPRRSPKKRHAV